VKGKGTEGNKVQKTGEERCLLPGGQLGRAEQEEQPRLQAAPDGDGYENICGDCISVQLRK
jgi:hypothetical protein